MTTHWHLDPKPDGSGYVLRPLGHGEQTSEEDGDLVPGWETVKDTDADEGDEQEAPAGGEG